jgi:metallo-beta-lactamase family protein
MPRLTFWGAAQTVTGSKHLVDLANGRRLLLDCGLFQGRGGERRNEDFGFAADTVDAVVLSHAHIDHIGLLPKLWKEGFRGRVYCTHATRDLAALLLLDSAHIQEKDVYYYNKRRVSRGQEPVDPLYETAHAEEVLRLFVGVGYHQPFEPVPGVTAHFRDAGHILGSASVHLTIREDGRTVRLGFTGDVGNSGRPILRDPEPMAECDYVISESTYGGKTHTPSSESKDALRQIIQRTAERGGKVIIPSFAVGRTQEIVYALDQLANEGALPDIPIYVDSPLAVNATSVFLAHPECFDAELNAYLREDPNPFGFERLSFLRKADDSKALNERSDAMVIISASGMATAGRVVHHLRNNVENPKTTVLMVGYCADGTTGRDLIEGDPTIRLFGDEFQVNAEVEVLNSFSAHADEPGMVEFLLHLDPSKLRQTFLVHGDKERAEKLKAALKSEGWGEVVIPAHGQTFDL